MKHIAIVLAAGNGKRMGTDCPKQYLEIKGKPVLYYCLKTFEESFMDEIIVVTRDCDIKFVTDEIINKYKFNKVSKVIAGGKERYESVYNALLAIENTDSYVYIHDGARAFVSQNILARAKESVEQNLACVVCVPSKDTVKISSENMYVKSTPKRSSLWCAQTPQVFKYEIIRGAFDTMKESSDRNTLVTDDASVVEMYSEKEVKIVEGEYTNIKITTPEDLIFGEFILNSQMR